ncbi:hypothetical protein GCM10010112_08640 [Actinoplanes lobatus]|uniref:Putative small lipoprotein YifL n=1 Tax=Actinoplanes lobatus TaxID=113568 RepID=A0A7W7HD42_9ACTN|nr:hypothetical protein [Actinoplanes lobatus]MBB4748330.1 putative small lipoprotein YifL [Actinoplanes lobatus]GGN56633.1 hypothetical protein GCM10010112_08640 [Actinoplanes lobatus]GIE37767.1 hypothetical protein Alo02nite_06650 [Actinoplanes lobatus]
MRRTLAVLTGIVGLALLAGCGPAVQASEGVRPPAAVVSSSEKPETKPQEKAAVTVPAAKTEKFTGDGLAEEAAAAETGVTTPLRSGPEAAGSTGNGGRAAVPADRDPDVSIIGDGGHIYW